MKGPLIIRNILQLMFSFSSTPASSRIPTSTTSPTSFMTLTTWTRSSFTRLFSLFLLILVKTCHYPIKTVPQHFLWQCIGISTFCKNDHAKKCKILSYLNWTVWLTIIEIRSKSRYLNQRQFHMLLSNFIKSFSFMTNSHSLT